MFMLSDLTFCSESGVDLMDSLQHADHFAWDICDKDMI